MSTQKLLERFYSDPKFDGTTTFYWWVRELAKPSFQILNLGAGPATRLAVRCFKGEVAEVVGADIDRVVLTNTELDRGILIANDRIPIEDSYFDLIYSDFVLEHVKRPREFLAEVHRLLKPGGSYLFRTPNRYHYVTIISSLTPHSFHEKVANPVRGMSEDAHEPWPTFYRMNTRSRLRRLAANAGFDRVELRMVECEPSYLQFHVVPFLIGTAYERVVNSTELLAGLRANIQGRFDKRQSP